MIEARTSSHCSERSVLGIYRYEFVGGRHVFAPTSLVTDCEDLPAESTMPAIPEALKQSHVKEFDATGRPMKGWVMVEPDGLDSDKQLGDWIERAVLEDASRPVAAKKWRGDQLDDS